MHCSHVSAERGAQTQRQSGKLLCTPKTRRAWQLQMLRHADGKGLRGHRCADGDSEVSAPRSPRKRWPGKLGLLRCTRWLVGTRRSPIAQHPSHLISSIQTTSNSSGPRGVRGSESKGVRHAPARGHPCCTQHPLRHYPLLL